MFHLPHILRPTVEKFRDWLTLNILKEPSVQPIYWTLSSVYLFRAIYTATELRIADLLYYKPMNIDQLASKTKTDSSSLERILRALCSFNIFKLGAGDKYENTSLSMQLLNSEENPISNWVLFSGNSENWMAYEKSTECIKSGKSAFEIAQQASFYDHMAQNDIYSAQFRAGMNAWSQWQSDQIISACNFEKYQMIVDIGGGCGALLAKILTSHPESCGLLFDTEQAIECAKTDFDALKLTERCRFQSGSFFAELPACGDVYILKHVLRDWDDAKCKEILKRCRDAITDNNRLILIEGVMGTGENSDRLQKMIDLEQLFWLGGRMRTQDEWTQLLSSCGFSVISVNGTSIADVTIIEATPNQVTTR